MQSNAGCPWLLKIPDFSVFLAAFPGSEERIPYAVAAYDEPANEAALKGR
jgi:hypothetical protein